MEIINEMVENFRREENLKMFQNRKNIQNKKMYSMGFTVEMGIVERGQVNRNVPTEAQRQ